MSLRFFIISTFLFSFFLAGSSHATERDKNPAASDCSESLSHLQASDFESGGGQNIFNRTLPSTLISAVTWLTAVQLQRSGGGSEFLSDAFLLTVPLDMGLTTVSHAVSLSKIPMLQRILQGRVFGDAYQFITRTGVNITMGVTAILSSWAISGISLSPGHCGAAVALCGVVYPTLQASKTLLHRTWPRKADLKLRSHLMKILPKPLAAHWLALRNRANELGVKTETAEAAQVSILDAQALSKPFEDLVTEEMLINDSKLEKLVLETRKIRALIEPPSNATTLEKSARRLKDLRSKIRHRILTDWPFQAEEILELGGVFDKKSSLLLQKELDSRFHSSRFKTLVASFIDQSLSVGVAGGVFLYAVNQWAQSGQIPWFLNGL